MRRSEPSRTGLIDGRGWLALAWAVGFGLVYAQMVLQARAPGVLATLRAILGGR